MWQSVNSGFGKRLRTITQDVRIEAREEPGKHFKQKEVVSNIYCYRMVKEDNDGKTALGLVIGMSVVKSAGAVLEAGGTRS